MVLAFLWSVESERDKGRGVGWYELGGGAAVGEGTGGEAHELKQGAHDEEEEPVHCSTHAHTRKYAQSTEADDEGMNMLCVCVCVCVS